MNRSTLPISQQATTNARQSCNSLGNNADTVNRRRRRPAVPPIRIALPPQMRTFEGTTQFQQQQQHPTSQQPLTFDTLAKKDTIDLLLNNNPFSTATNKIKRRRSICNGYIARQLYNEDNTPIPPAKLSKQKRACSSSDTSANSAITQASINNLLHVSPTEFNGPRRRRRHSSHMISSKAEDKEIDSSIDTLLNRQRQRQRQPNHQPHHSQYTDSQSVNTSCSSSCNLLYNDSEHHPTITEYPRRFSGIVRLSAAHIALNRAKKDKSTYHRHSISYRCVHKVAAMARRVVNTRSPEPSDTLIPMDELFDLASYIYQLKKGLQQTRTNDTATEQTYSASVEEPDSEDETITEVERNKSTVDSKITQHYPSKPAIGISIDEQQDIESYYEHLHSTAITQSMLSSSPQTSVIPSSTNNRRKGRLQLGTLNNIFPFSSLSRIPSFSRSVSENSQLLTNRVPTETDSLLGPTSTTLPLYAHLESQSPQTTNTNRKLISMSGIYKQIQRCTIRCRHLISDMVVKNWNTSSNEHFTQIKFEGWSLFMFSPSSEVRLSLWKIIASKPFEMLIFVLLISQWIIMSFVPVIFDLNQSHFDRTADYLLLIIYIIYTLEMICKIVVYGFVNNSHSRKKPNPIKWFKRLARSRIIPSIVKTVSTTHDAEIQGSPDSSRNDINSSFIHTSLQEQQRLLPPYAAKNRSLSSGTSAAASIKDMCHSTHSPSDSSIRSGSPSNISNFINSPLSEINQSTQRHVSENTFLQDSSATPNYGTIFDSVNVHPLDKSSSQDFDFSETIDKEEQQSSSFLDELEYQVSASLTPAAPHQSDTGGDVDFLKISHKSFLSDTSNIIDLISIVSYWADIFTLVILRKRPWPVLQTFAAARLLRLLVITEGSTVIMKSLSSSYDMLKNVLGFFIFFWLLFSLAALFIFMNAFTRRCAVMPEDGRLFQGMSNIEYVEPRLSCAGFITGSEVRTGPFDLRTGKQYLHPGTDGFFCKSGQVCIQDTANQPSYGFMSYENIFYSMLNVLTVISTENWTDLLYISQDSISDKGSAIFYTFCLFLMTFMLVPMFIAVITTSFSHIRGDMRESAFSSKRKAPQLLSGKHSNHENDTAGKKQVFSKENMFGNNYSQRPITLQEWAQYITHDARFRCLGNFCAALNIVVLTFYRFDLPPQEKYYLDYCSLFFTVIFTLEIVMRLYGHPNWKSFWKQKNNRIDLSIVVATLFDLFVFQKGSYYSDYLVIFAVFRSYRIAYLFPGVLQLVTDVVGDGQGIRNLTFFTFLVLLLLAPISVQLFGGDFQFADANEPTMRFDNSYQAFLALFQIMTGENWTDILYDAMHSQESSSISYAALFIVFLYFIVHYIVLNLFIAVIMENFDLDEEQIKQYQIKKYIREHQWKPENVKIDKLGRILLPLFVSQDQKRLDSKKLPQNLVAGVTMSDFHDFITDASSLNISGKESDTHSTNQLKLGTVSKQRRPSSIYSNEIPVAHFRRHSVVSQLSNHSLVMDPLPASYMDYDDGSQTKYDDEYELNVAQENKAVILENLKVFRSFAFIKTDAAIRQICIRLLTRRWYNRLMVALIGVSTLLAMWTDEFRREKYASLVYNVLEPTQAVLLFVYWVDIVMHMIADGVFMLPKSYLRSGWNLIDMIDLTFQLILTILIVSINSSGNGCTAKYISYLRILRIWRAVRIVYYVNSMRVIFSDLVYGLPKMIDAVALNVLVFVPFAIYGCYLFSGRFALCNDNNVDSKAECYGEFITKEEGTPGILIPKIWKNPYDYSFDTFGQSLLHLFECASGEGWIFSLFSAMSVIPEDNSLQPRFSWSSLSIYHSAYYVVFMFVASLCSIQLFIGVFLEIFKQRNGISTLTNTQRQFQDLQRQLALIKPSLKANRPSDNTIRAFFFDLIIDKRGKFAKFMTAVTAVNIVIFATQHLHQPAWLTKFQDILNALCLCCYVFEMFAKIVGLGFYKWVFNKWNMYDFIFVTLAIVTSIPKMYIELPFGWDVTRKVVLIGIAFRLAQRHESLDVLFRSVNRALPSIFSVTFVFFIVVVCFGVVFQESFSFTRYGVYGNEHANFRSLYSTILTLIRITTGENWDFLMHDFTVIYPECVNEKDCGSPKIAIVLFIIFYVVCTYIFVNLYTVIVIDHFSFTFDRRNQFTLITRTDLRNFKRAWSELDPRATGYIDLNDVHKFLSKLDGALSIRIYENEHCLKSLLEASSQPSTNTNGLIAIPLSEAKPSHSRCTNTLGERLFNLHELNKRLSSIDREVILQRKRQYEEVYQEIKITSSRRGIAFQKMLEILAIRLVDVSKSLTFEELVNRARLEDKVASELSAKRAKGLVAMLLQRRRFLKRRNKSRYNQELSNGDNMELLRSWLTPISPQPTPNFEAPNPFASTLVPSFRPPPPLNEPPSGLLFGSSSIFKVPRIVVDSAGRQSFDKLETFPPSSPASQYHSLLLPDACSTNNVECQNLSRRRNSSPNVNPLSRHTLITNQRSNSISVTPTDIPSSASETSSIVSFMSLPECSLQVDGEETISARGNPTFTTDHERNEPDNQILEINPEVDIFSCYYTAEASVESMSSIDADRIAERLENSAWSDLLQATKP